MAEVEQSGEWAGQFVDGAIADAAQPPIVLDEADDRRLIGDRVVDRVDPGPGEMTSSGRRGP